MALVFSEEQKMIQDSVKEFYAANASIEQLRTLRDRGDEVGYDKGVWQQMAELGYSGVNIPEAFGGTGFGFQGLGVLLIETGRALAPSPLVSTMLLGVEALLLGGSAEQQASLLPAIAKGEHCMTLALDETPRYQPFAIGLSASKKPGAFVLNGRKIMVIDGMTADRLIVVARTSGQSGERAGLSLFLVANTAEGLQHTRLLTVDSRAYANLEFKNVQVEESALLGTQDEGANLLEPLLDRASTGIATELLGTTEKAFEMTLDYLKAREQFGTVIGAFQALKHRMADMFCELELARSTVLDALHKADDADANAFASAACLCKAKVCEVARNISNEAVQMHGGIGMTDEHNIGFFLKRARALEHLFGSSAWHRNRYAKLQGY